jgi:hypothetical protein
MVQVFSQRLCALSTPASLIGLVDGGVAAIAVLSVGFGLAAVLGILN